MDLLEDLDQNYLKMRRYILISSEESEMIIKKKSTLFIPRNGSLRRNPRESRWYYDYISHPSINLTNERTPEAKNFHLTFRLPMN